MKKYTRAPFRFHYKLIKFNLLQANCFKYFEKTSRLRSVWNWILVFACFSWICARKKHIKTYRKFDVLCYALEYICKYIENHWKPLKFLANSCKGEYLCCPMYLNIWNILRNILNTKMRVSLVFRSGRRFTNQNIPCQC